MSRWTSPSRRRRSPVRSPTRVRRGTTTTAADDDDNIAFDRMSEDDLLSGIEGLIPPEKNDDF